MAVGMITLMSGDIAQVNIMNAFPKSQVPEFLKGIDGGWGQPGEFVTGEKP
jgi:hypothetical protein